MSHDFCACPRCEKIGPRQPARADFDRIMREAQKLFDNFSARVALAEALFGWLCQRVENEVEET